MYDNPYSSRGYGGASPSGGNDHEVRWSVQEVRVIVRKYGRMIAIVTGVIFLIALLYVATATRQYTASARLLIDTPRNPISALEGGASGGSTSLGIPEVESSVQVLVSDRVGSLVLASLRKDDNGILAPGPKASFMEELVGTVLSVPRRILSIFTPSFSESDPHRFALEKLMSGLSVRRVGTSYVLEISYTATNPKAAAAAANAFSQTFVQDEIDSKAEIWKRASVWLQDRVNELRQRSEEASRAAQDFKTQNGNNADTWPKSRELDRTAEAYDALYSAFLRRYTDSIQQQTFPITQARVITDAYPPLSPSQPRSIVIMGLALVMGLGLGTGIAFIRWSLDHAIRSPAQIARYGFRCLATLPRLPRVISRDVTQVVRTVTTAPRSQFAESLRVVRAEISIAERQRPMRYIGVTSAFSGEGKSTIAANLAQLFAASSPTLLIDADTRNPQLTHALSPTAVTDHEGEAHIETVGGCPGLHFLGVVPHMQAGSAWFEQGGFEAMLNEVGPGYAKVIVDLPPAGLVAEARTVAPLLDAIIVIVEWESTSAEAFVSCIEACHVEPGKVFGVILNKAHPNVIAASKGSAYTNNHYISEPVETGTNVRKSRLRI
ncbi:MAG: hypothetical protein JWN07_1643 [Hyphomicrobiales bacterium]|nr:hypothetical protein [Hyphomicrobiales bacterium]